MSEVTICNLALSHLGDTAQVTSIKPPDGSVQAQLCANFYYQARNALLEMHAWGFATRRAVLAAVSDPLAAGNHFPFHGTPNVPTPWPPSGPNQTSPFQHFDCEGKPWRFSYAKPSAVLTVLAVQPRQAQNDYEVSFGPIERDHFPPYPQGYLPVPGAPMYVPQPYAIETLDSGLQVVLTNVPDAVMRYTTVVTDTTQFSPLFTLSLSYLLASMLAGPIIKGDAGMQAGEQMLEMLNSFKNQAESNDANQRKTDVEPAVAWIRGR